MPIYSAVTGAPLPGAEFGAEYWYRNLREKVDFERAAHALIEDGIEAFIEVSPHPVLTPALEEVLEGADLPAPLVLGSLQRSGEDSSQFLRFAARGYVNGLAIDWEALLEHEGAQPVDLPTYPFQRQRYWLDLGSRLSVPLIKQYVNSG